jgi:predicted nucleic acid-binding protein
MLGVLVMAKKTGHAVTVKPLIEQLRSRDFYMSTDLYQEVLKATGEVE